MNTPKLDIINERGIDGNTWFVDVVSDAWHAVHGEETYFDVVAVPVGKFEMYRVRKYGRDIEIVGFAPTKLAAFNRIRAIVGIPYMTALEYKYAWRNARIIASYDAGGSWYSAMGETPIETMRAVAPNADDAILKDMLLQAVKSVNSSFEGRTAMIQRISKSILAEYPNRVERMVALGKWLQGVYKLAGTLPR